MMLLLHLCGADDGFSHDIALGDESFLRQKHLINVQSYSRLIEDIEGRSKN
jgi:hypothetical protein